MKNLLSIFFILSAALMIPAVPGENQDWVVFRSPTRENLGRLDMISPNEGWAFSYDGLILKYDGSLWRISDSLSNAVSHINDADTVKNRLGTPGDIYAIRMLNPDYGWMAVNNPNNRTYLLFQFINGEWQPLNRTFPVRIRAMDFDDSQGWAVGQQGIMKYNGLSWESEHLPVVSDFRAVQILPGGQVFACGGTGTLLRYQDNDWTAIPTPAPVLLRDLDFLTPDLGWLVGDDGALWQYENGRISQVQSVTSANLWALDMTDSLTGWAVGENGVILRCENNEWSLANSPTSADLHDIEMTAAEEGWIVGAWGNILRLSRSTPAGARARSHQFQFIGQVHLGSDYLMDRISDVNGVAVADFNGDRRPDIYLTCLRSLNHCLINQGGGYYRDMVIESGTGGNIENRVGTQLYERGALAADFDHDGDTDLLLYGNSGTLRYFVNDGRGTFSDVTTRCGIPTQTTVQFAAAGDLDEDGYPDLFLAGNQGAPLLLLNQKYNRFRQMPFADSANGAGVQCANIVDLNGDGHQDMVILYQNRHMAFFENNGEAAFTRNNSWQHPEMPSSFVNSIAFFDADNDGDHELYFCTENGRDAFWLNRTAADSGRIVFEDATVPWQVLQEGRSYSAVPGDFDHDGDPDLYVSRFGPDLYYMNNAFRQFTEVFAPEIHSKAKYNNGFNTAAASLDMDGDGDLDLVVGNRDYWSSLLENTQDDSAAIILFLEGVRSNRDALGAKVWFYPAGEKRDRSTLLAFRENTGGTGYFSQNSNIVHAAFPGRRPVDIEIRFLGGAQKLLKNVTPGITLHIREEGPLVALGYSSARFLLGTWHSSRIRLEILKFIIFAIVAVASVRFFEKRYQWRSLHTAIYMITLMGIYSIFTLTAPFSPSSLRHALPFTIIALILATVVSVNEQNYKTALRKTFLKKKLEEANTRLSNETLIVPILDIVSRTIGDITPVRCTIVYLYNEMGNFFVAKQGSGQSVPAGHDILRIPLPKLKKLAALVSPLQGPQMAAYIKALPEEMKQPDGYFYPAVNRGELFGLIFLQKPTGADVVDNEIHEVINSLSRQFAMAIRNLRILQMMDDHEKMVAIGTFASGIIHDLKNPIDGLRLITEVLHHETPPDDPKFEYVKELYEGILRLKRDLINSFNVVGRNDAKQASFDLNQLLKTITAGEKYPYGMFQLNLEDTLPPLEGNELQLRHAFENIIRNAWEASGPDGTVSIRSRLQKRPPRLVVEIKDTGKGISPGDLERIFNMFYTTKGHGRGLGLTISRNIIEDHNGNIFIENINNQGTMVKIVLPLKATGRSK